MGQKASQNVKKIFLAGIFFYSQILPQFSPELRTTVETIHIKSQNFRVKAISHKFKIDTWMYRYIRLYIAYRSAQNKRNDKKFSKKRRKNKTHEINTKKNEKKRWNAMLYPFLCNPMYTHSYIARPHTYTHLSLSVPLLLSPHTHLPDVFFCCCPPPSSCAIDIRT